MKKILLIITMSILLLPGLNAQSLVQQANNAIMRPTHPLYPASNGVTNKAETDQIKSGYKKDAWEDTYIHQGDTVTQGLGGSSCYYSVPQALRDVGYDSIRYWQSLQVKRSPTRGYRTHVKLYIVNTDSIPVSIGKALANTSVGPGGAWQFFIESTNASRLTSIDTVNLTDHP